MYRQPAVARPVSRRAVLRAAVAAPLMLSGLARAEDSYPARPLRLVVPFPAGGSSDALGRVVAAALAKTLGQSVIVENHGGAGGNIAGEYVARAAPDGYTLLMAGQGILAINQPLYGHLRYDPASFEYIGMMGDNANVLLANPQALAVNSVADLVAQARQKPGEIAYGSNGIGSLSHLTAEIFANAAGVKFLHVPYQGAAPMATDLRAGRIAFCVTGSTLAVSLSKGSGLRPLAVTTGVRLPQLPGTPTLVESGYPTLEAPSWWAAMVPAHTPAPVLERLRQAFTAATSTPDYKHALELQSTLPHPMAASAASGFLENERKKWATAVQSSGAKAS